MFNIAIDGFSGSGKSTLTKELAKRLGFRVLDTGAIFRCMAWGYAKMGLGEPTEKTIETFLKKAKVEVRFDGESQRVLFNGEDATPYIRTEEISQLSSKISAFPKAREEYLKIAKKFAAENDCIMEGRDIGTVVMPGADIKIFLTADEKVRAERRWKDIRAKDKKCRLEDVLSALRERDERDVSREVGKLMTTEESIIVDNSDMTFEQTVDFCYDLITKKLNLDKKVNVAIDGYVCSGKSTIAKLLAKRLGFKVFDTGAIYRAVACAFEYMHLDENKISEKYIKKFSEQINIEIDFIDGVQHVKVNGIDHTPYIRTERISALSAKIAPFTSIRDKVLKIQRDFAQKNDLVMEGRDIGSHVLPNADFKFFCTAEENVRAKRRFEQQNAMGKDVTFKDVLKELKERDYRDVHRDHGAIVQTEDSILVDTTNQNVDQSVEFCVEEMKKRGFKG